MKKYVIFCTGNSGSGKTYFIKNLLPKNTFHILKSATTRQMRSNEKDGCEYYFRDENYFTKTKFATHLWVNEAFWIPGQLKWLYGVPEFEILNNIGKHMVYDVIEPKYVREMIEWFKKNKLNRIYDFKTIYFVPSENNKKIINKRVNMPNDQEVRQNNTCLPIDFLRANLNIDFLVKCSKEETIIPHKLTRFLLRLSKTK